MNTGFQPSNQNRSRNVYSSSADGKAPPHDINVIVEIPYGGPPVKYELDKNTGRLYVDRFLSTPMIYPGSYGFVPDTLSLDGDPLDVLICDKTPLVPGAVMNCRPIGVLIMEDESGMDEKIVAVPNSSISAEFGHLKSIQDLPEVRLSQIEYFFEHYKDLENGKWVEIKRWDGPEKAIQLIQEAIELAEMTSRPKMHLSCSS